MNSTCTWYSAGARCTDAAAHLYHDAAGRVWANLCGTHSLTLDYALASDDFRTICSAWIKASGGSKRLTSTF